MTHVKALAALCLLTALTACGSTVQVSWQSGAASQDGLGSLGGPTAAPVTGGEPAGTAGSEVGTAPVGGSGQPGSGSAPTATDASTAGSTATSGPLSTVAGPATSGRGWTSTTAFLGVPTQEDLHQAAGGFGVSVDPGSFQKDVSAFVADVNSHGGVLGRKVVPLYYDVRTADTQSNPNQVAQAACTFFTQDHKVIAVLNALGGIDTDNWRACLGKAKTPLMTLGVGTYDQDMFSKGGPSLQLNGAPTLESFVPVWVARLKAQGYFGGWNTTTGNPVAGAAKVGLMEPNSRLGKHINAMVTSALKANGIKVVSEFAYTDTLSSYTGDMTAAQLQFASAGVTHVVNLPPVSAALFLFMQTAEQQHYRPVYAVSSYILPLFFQQNAPAVQMKGMKGAGWFPPEDVDTAHDTGATSATKACTAELKKQNVVYSGDGGRVALGAAFALCDAVHLVVASATQAKGLDADALKRGGIALGSTFPIASTFGGQVTATRQSRISFVRDLSFSGTCSCFVFTGTGQRL